MDNQIKNEPVQKINTIPPRVPIPNEKNQPDCTMLTISQVQAKEFMFQLSECIIDIQNQKLFIQDAFEQRRIEENAAVQQVKAERMLIKSDTEAFKNETMSKFNALLDATKGIKDKFDLAENYENYLETKLENMKLGSDVTALERQLQKERTEVSNFISEMTTTIKLGLERITDTVDDLKSADEIIEKNIDRFTGEITERNKVYEDKLDNRLSEITESIRNAVDNQIGALKKATEDTMQNLINTSNEYLSDVKTESINFLKECDSENKSIIKKIPSVKDKSSLSKKDMLLIFVSAIAIVCSVIAII